LITSEARIEHPELGELVWQCGYGCAKSDVGLHKLIQDFDREIITYYDEQID
jgi:hypothetical protein